MNSTTALRCSSFPLVSIVFHLHGTAHPPPPPLQTYTSFPPNGKHYCYGTRLGVAEVHVYRARALHILTHAKKKMLYIMPGWADLWWQALRKCNVVRFVTINRTANKSRHALSAAALRTKHIAHPTSWPCLLQGSASISK